MEGIRRGLTPLTYPERLPLWKWHETGAFLRGFGILGLGVAACVGTIAAVVRHGAAAGAGLGAAAVFGGTVLTYFACHDRRTSSPAARRFEAVLGKILTATGLIVVGIIALALVAAVYLFADCAADYAGF